MYGLRGRAPVGIAVGAFVVLALMAEASEAAWVNSDWKRRLPMTADAAQVEGTDPLVDFTLLVVLDSSHSVLFGQAKPDGSDLLFTSGDGVTVLDREIVSYDSGAQTAEIWVRTDQLSKTANRFYVYYSNPDTTITSPGTDAWKPEYRAVYHFSGDPGQGTLTDSSPAGADAPLNPSRWSSGDVTSGQIHQGWSFNGQTNHIATTAISTEDSSYVFGAWLLHTAAGTDFFIQASPGFWHTSSQTPSTGRPNYAGGLGAASWNPTPVPLNDGYHHFAWACDGEADSVTFYYDGEPQTLRGMTPGIDTVYTGVPINPVGMTPFPVGIVGPSGFIVADLMHGAADEFRLHEGMLSSEWIKTEYNNQKDPASFLVFGSEQVPTRRSSWSRLKSRY